MNRRDFLRSIGAASVVALAPSTALGGTRVDYANLLILVELKGGNDGLNTVIPYASREYYDLRPRLAIARDRVLQLDSVTGLHPSLEPLMPMWRSGELAVVQGMGYPDPNLSHFRSIEIWDTAAASNQYLREGWLSRAFTHAPPPQSFSADGIVVGGADLGPLGGGRVRAIALSNPAQFVRQARLAAPQTSQNGHGDALRHIFKVESDIAHAAEAMPADNPSATDFPNTPFGSAVRTAVQVTATGGGVAAIKLALNGFDTHSGQLATQARLLTELAEGLAALKEALVTIGRWQSTLVLTYSEFGRRPRENQSGGTDHGTASAHFVLGGSVKGGFYGEPPALSRLDGNGNLLHSVDFRDLYATVIERWWNGDSTGSLGRRYNPLGILRV